MYKISFMYWEQSHKVKIMTIESKITLYCPKDLKYDLKNCFDVHVVKKQKIVGLK